MKITAKMARLGMETAFDVLAQAKALEAQGKNVIHLEIGEPDFDTPSSVVVAAEEALRQGHTHYGPSQGLPELREQIAAEASRVRGMEFHPSQVVVTPGAKPIMYFAITILAEEGDEVIYPDPGFPIYQSMIDFVGARAVPLVLKEENDFSIDLDELRSKITPEDHPADPELPREPDRRRRPRRSTGGDRRPGGEARPLGALRRDIPAHHLQRGARQHRQLPRHGGANHHPRRLLQDLRHDRLEARLRHRPGAAGTALREAGQQQRLLHPHLRPAGRAGLPRDRGRTCSKMVEQFAARRRWSWRG